LLAGGNVTNGNDEGGGSAVMQFGFTGVSGAHDTHEAGHVGTHFGASHVCAHLGAAHFGASHDCAHFGAAQAGFLQPASHTAFVCSRSQFLQQS
jgi:hypothetical protein